jgi:hypothetical protein
MRVTFDSNVYDKVVRPAMYPRDPEIREMIVVHQALKDGRIQGFTCETVITLEGIGRDDRAMVFGSTHSRRSVAQIAEDTFAITLTTEQPDRRPVHPKQRERLIEAFRLGVRLLGAPRVGIPQAETQFHVIEDPAMQHQRLGRFVSLLRQIEERGLGSARAVKIAARYVPPEDLKRLWFTALGAAAKDITERREIARAVAEWADADTIAAHYGYGNDVFCTLDFAKAETKRGEPAVFDSDNRAWLTHNFGIQFVTLARLADMVKE